MREYVLAVREIWRAWQESRQPAFAGKHYTINLNVPLFDPGPIEHPEIPIHLAAVNPYMCQVAGEVADGLRPHPVCTPHYIETVMWPAVRAGAAKTGRKLDDFSMSIKPLVATAPTLDALAERVRDVRARVAFYASTPAYRAAFEAHGLGALADELKLLSRAQRWEEMPQHITDDVLNLYATVGTYDVIADKLAERYGVAPSVIASYAKSHNCMKRREQTATRVAVRTEEKLIELRADEDAVAVRLRRHGSRVKVGAHRDG
jgi:probable F420-dependent oxidoreductase